MLVAVAVSLLGAVASDRPGRGAGCRPWRLPGAGLESAIFYALHIVLVSSCSRGSATGRSSCPLLQYAVVAVIGAALSGSTPNRPTWASSVRGALPTIAYAGILSGGVGYTLQIVAQRYTPATEAALIMSLESVFAAIAAAILLGERLTMLAAMGCGLVLLGVVMVEIIPILPRRGRRAGRRHAADRHRAARLKGMKMMAKRSATAAGVLSMLCCCRAARDSAGDPRKRTGTNSAGTC